MNEDITPESLGEHRFFNRELSWLSFNKRVLEQAQCEKYPLLERVRFLAYFSANLDEFFEIRVSGLVEQLNSLGGAAQSDADDLSVQEQLKLIRKISLNLVRDQYACWNEQIVPALKSAGIHFKSHNELGSNESRWVERYYHDQVYPILTPLAIDPAHPFPQFANKGMNLLVWLEDKSHPDAKKRIAVVPVPRVLPRVIEIQNKSSKATKSYAFLSEILRLFVHTLFPGYSVISSWAFRITRNSDLYIDEEQSQNLLQEIEEELLNRRKGAAVRLEIQKGVPRMLLDEMLQFIHLHEEGVFLVEGPPNLGRLMGVYDLIDRPDLKFPSFSPRVPLEFQCIEKIFEEMGQHDILLHHPYDSFTPVSDFIEQAAKDPSVLAIKQTLYRTSGDSPVVAALKQASENGKQVTALVELKARFDEANNIHWARLLEDAGVHVVYGLVGLKIHCKMCLVVRREGSRIRRYVHLGTGNYNPKTAKTYTDFSLFTANEVLTADVADLFNTLTGFSIAPRFQNLLVAPFNLHTQVDTLINQETLNAKEGKPAYMFIKVNSLLDHDVIKRLYLASGAGVKIDLLVRGICALIPGVKGLSENITVRSILGRFLEHSRIFYFLNYGNEPKIYLGSADWMPRNFYSRVETVFPVLEPVMRDHIIQEIIKVYLMDNQDATALDSNGHYIMHASAPQQNPLCAQSYFMQEAQAHRLTTAFEREENEETT